MTTQATSQITKVPDYPIVENYAYMPFEHMPFFLAQIGILEKNITPQYVINNQHVYNILLFPIMRSLYQYFSGERYVFSPQEINSRRLFFDVGPNYDFHNFIMTKGCYNDEVLQDDAINSNCHYKDKVTNGSKYGIGFTSIMLPENQKGFWGKVNIILNKITKKNSVFLSCTIKQGKFDEVNNYYFAFAVHGSIAEYEYVKELISNTLEPILAYSDYKIKWCLEFKQGYYENTVTPSYDY